jgi:FKBP-type peptidyl-prolyl cis-trans isomerase
MKIVNLLTLAALSLLALTVHGDDAPATQPAERTTASGLKIIETKPLSEAMTAATNDTVWVNYTGKLQDGTIFDSSLTRTDEQGDPQPIKFHLGQGNVIKGWDEGIVGMKVGEKRTLIIPPDLAYGAQGAGGKIPPNATLTFDVELVGISRPGK